VTAPGAPTALEGWSGERLDDFAAFEANDAPPVAARERQRRRKPVADNRHLRVCVHAILKPRQPRV